MPAFVTARVLELTSERAGLQRLRTDHGRAYALTHVVGPVAVGDDVVLNTTAVDLGLGTGGWHVVHWNLARSSWSERGPGHIMKLRYTSVQADVGAAEEHGEEGTEDLGPLDRLLAGRPVVVASVHSQVAAVAAALRVACPSARLAYVMTDGGALPLALSDLVADLRERGLLDLTVTAGQAFGGELEAVNVPSALAVAVGAGADAIVVSMGPGGVGTGTVLGHTALEVAPALDAASALGANAIVALRVSGADPRPRHQGVSHHSTTALALAARPADVPVPDSAEGAAAGEHLAALGLAARHRVVTVPALDPVALFERFGLEVRSMGRSVPDDPAFFAFAAAAGTRAAQVVSAGAPDTLDR